MSTPAAVLGHRLADVLHGVGSTVDRDAEVPPRLIDELARSGALAAMVPAEYGGRPLGFAEYGRLCALVAAESAALQSLLTVHGMVCLSIARWAGADARARFLPRLAAGELLGAFALSEEEAGSDMRAIRTTATAGPTAAAGRLVNGQKKWISFGTAAGLFLVFAKAEDGELALLVERDAPGVQVRPAPRTAGFRGGMLGELTLTDCLVPPESILGRPGTGLSRIALGALTLGRLCVAFGSLGLARSACDAALEHSGRRRQFGVQLREHQLVAGLLADAVAATESAELLCERAAAALDADDEWSQFHVLLAKLTASRAASGAAGTAAQLHGAAGLVEGSPVERYVRDARVMEVIEGNTQLIQQLISAQAVARQRATRAQEPRHAR
ncbi:acyl-CoA dehydrogenase family protein [Kitasatospora sp. NBC_01266]|uniref:acyl-CoA dehydrogenase family protein n=1 Tax=Kitasatospora sp. NBC_01266 TaxID=2903572 RepID=UPI002E34A021|nr:acyl-CoA dehydrogenase family protein [Kitasatospora sp. NBC_01266]